MKNEEAAAVLEQELATYRDETYADLVLRLPGEPITCERMAPTGTKYQIEVQFFWDDQPGGNVRILGSIDDFGLRAFVPLNRSFIKAPDGSFVGE